MYRMMRNFAQLEQKKRRPKQLGQYNELFTLKVSQCCTCNVNGTFAERWVIQTKQMELAGGL